MSHLFLITLMLSLVVDTAALVVLAAARDRSPNPWRRSLLVWSALALTAHLTYAAGVFLEIYAFVDLNTTVRVMVHGYGWLIAATCAAPVLLWKERGRWSVLAFALTVVGAVAYATSNSIRLFGLLSERWLAEATAGLYGLSALWFAAVALRANRGDGAARSPSSALRHFPAIAAGAAFALAADALFTGHRIHDGIHAGFLIRPAITMLRGAALIGLLVRSQRLAGARGEPHRSIDDASAPLEAFCRRHGLTAREREVVASILDGKTARETADDLCVSSKTVNAHLYNVYRKAGVRNRSELNRDVYVGRGDLPERPRS